MTGEGGVEAADYRSSSTIFVKYYVCYTVFTNKDWNTICTSLKCCLSGTVSQMSSLMYCPNISF